LIPKKLAARNFTLGDDPRQQKTVISGKCRVERKPCVDGGNAESKPRLPA
jgi:hypothetical protein